MKSNIRKTLIMMLALTLAFTGLAALANDTNELKSANNSIPIAENIEISTFRGIAVNAKFKALDPDGDMISFEITSAPKKGTAVISDTCGFMYTPNEGAKGKDSFHYVAVDKHGNVSSAATVTINIKKQSTKTTYSDMDGHEAHYAALVLAEEGIFVGERLGGEAFFRPDTEITRGEFLTLCMALTGTDAIEGITMTGFADDSEFPMWVKPYISTGIMNGYVGGYRNENGKLVFAPDSPITFAEASVVLNKILGITDVPVSSFESDSIPVWAQAASTNLAACNILPSGLAGIADETVTRADTALLMVSALEVLNERVSSKGILAILK